MNEIENIMSQVNLFTYIHDAMDQVLDSQDWEDKIMPEWADLEQLKEWFEERPQSEWENEIKKVLDAFALSKEEMNENHIGYIDKRVWAYGNDDECLKIMSEEQVEDLVKCFVEKSLNIDYKDCTPEEIYSCLLDTSADAVSEFQKKNDLDADWIVRANVYVIGDKSVCQSPIRLFDCYDELELMMGLEEYFLDKLVDIPLPNEDELNNLDMEDERRLADCDYDIDDFLLGRDFEEHIDIVLKKIRKRVC